MLLLVPALVLSQATHYAIVPEETELLALTSPAGLFAGASHPHVITAPKVRGEVIYDANAPETSSVSLEFQAKDLGNDDPALRRRFHMTSMLSIEDRKKVAADMVGADQLDVKKYPTVSFTSRHVRRLDAEHLEVSGAMTLRGVAAELTLPVKVTVHDGVLRGEGTVGITHAMFGFRPFSTALGTIRNAEPITLELRIVARAMAPDGGS